MLIRRLLPSDDRMAVSRIYEESWKSAYSGIIPQNFLDSIPHGRWCGRLDSSDLTSLVCIESGSFIGTASFTHSRFAQFPDCGEIVSLYLLPQFIGKGYGKALLTNAVYELKTIPHKDCTSETQSDFLSDCTEILRAYYRMPRDFCAI